MATFENLQVKRLAVHEVVLASVLNSERQPLMSQALTQLDAGGLQLVSRRLAEALGTESHSIEVSIQDSAEGSTFQLAVSLLGATDVEFVSRSQYLATKLSRAQTVGSIRGGVAVVIEATVGSDASPRRIIAIVKAESDPAFVKRNLQQGVSLEFVREMIFGAQQRLFKVGAFLEKPGASTPTLDSDFEIVVYDHQMNIKGAGSAAQYFYATFLGATMVASTPQLNKQFFDGTIEFVNNSTRPRQEKWALRGDLISYFRSTGGTIAAREFADRHFPDGAEKRAYLRFLREAGVPGRAIQKDSRFIVAHLRHRRLNFSNGVNLSARADGFDQQVEIVETSDQSTTVRIAGKLLGET